MVQTTAGRPLTDHRDVRRLIVALLATLAVLVGPLAAPSGRATAAAAAAQGPVSVGHPVEEVLLIGGTVAPGPDGGTAIWNVASGTPARLVAIEPGTGELLGEYPLADAGGSWAVTTAPDGSVVVGTYSDAHVYRWSRTGGLVDLGGPPAGETFVWDVTTGDDGTIYGGSSPGGRVWAKNPATGAVRDLGQVADGHAYVRSLAWHDGTLYAGTDPPATVVAVDPATGQRRELPPPPGIDVTAVWAHDVDVRGDYLFVRFGEATPGPLAVYDLTTQQWTHVLDRVHGLEPSPPDENGAVYVVRAGQLTRFDPATDQTTGTGLVIEGRVNNTRAIGWADLDLPDFPGRSVVGTLWRGATFAYNPTTGAHRVVQSEIPGGAAPVNALGTGPDGRVYAGGFLSGGLATLDPATGVRLDYAPTQQVEGLATVGDLLAIGTYPGAGVHLYDPDLAWNTVDRPGDGPPNPRLVATFAEQDQTRATALVAAGDLLAVGTEPDLGAYGGVLALIDPSTGDVVHSVRAPVPDLSFQALAYSDGVLVAATSVYGGQSSTTPRAAEAVVFGWSVAERRVLWTAVPEDGFPTVADVETDGAGRVWAATGGRLTAYDPATGRVLDRRVVSTSGRSAQLAYNRVDGRLYISGGNQGVSWIDPSGTASGRVMDADSFHITAAPSGAVFFSVGTEVFRYASGAVARPVAQPRATDDSCPAGEVPPAGFPDVSGANAPAVDCLAWWKVTEGLGDGTYQPAGSVTRAQMASFVARALRTSGYALPAGPNAFPDDDWSPHAADIDALAAAGVVRGKAGGVYDPRGSVTRVEMAAFLMRSLELRLGAGGLELPSADGDYFADDDGYPLSADVNRAATAGIAGGYTDGTYRPSQPVRRDHMALFVTRWLDVVVEEGLAETPH